MKSNPSSTIPDLTERIRGCESLHDIEELVMGLQTEFDHYSLSDQSFLLALLGVTMMTKTTMVPGENLRDLHLSKLLSQLKWN